MPLLDIRQSLETGKVVGLHFAGVEERANYFVPSIVIDNLLKQIPRTFFTTGTTIAPAEILSDTASFAELVPRNCTLQQYDKIQVPSFKISGKIITYASPDSTFAVTKRLFDKAKRSILIGIYDFSAQHMVEIVLGALERGVTVSLMLDIDSENERKVFNKLKRYGVECVPAPSCASRRVSYFASSHEKVIVIDDEWTIIQSGRQPKTKNNRERSNCTGD